MLEDDIPDRKPLQNKPHIGHLKVNDRGIPLTNRPPHHREKSGRIGNVLEHMSTTDQIPSVLGVLLTVEILDIGYPSRGRTLNALSLVARIKTNPSMAK